MLITNSRDNCIKLIDLRMLKVLKTFSSDTYTDILSGKNIAFGERDQYIIGGSRNGILNIWDLSHGRLKTKLENGHKKSLTGLSYNVLSNYLYSADEEGYICYWN